MNIYSSLQKSIVSGKKHFAVLIDPDKYNLAALKRVVKIATKSGADYFFFGGSLLTKDNQDQFILTIRELSKIPVILFPGNSLQLNAHADGILLLSLISGRNPDMLIGRHVISAPFLKSSGLEILPTGYMLIESGRMTTVTYMSNTTPIPSNKDEIAVCTAMAGEMLGLKLIYMDAGSGAEHPVPGSMIRKVKAAVKAPLIIGGGITTPELAKKAWDSGADVVVIGNAIETNPELIKEISKACQS